MPTPVCSGPSAAEVEAIRARHEYEMRESHGPIQRAEADRGVLLRALDASEQARQQAERERDEARDACEKFRTASLTLAGQAQAAEAREGNLRALLQRIEWVPRYDRAGAVAYCPKCDAMESLGHTSWCQLKAALAPAAGQAWGEAVRAAVGALKDVADDVCGALCPTTWKTVTPRPHAAKCAAVRAALARLGALGVGEET
jgi:hypothetical protein